MTSSAKQRVVSISITIFLIVGIHIFLFLARIPAKDFTDIYKKLNEEVWTQFLPKKMTIEEPEPKKQPEKEIEQPKKEVEPNVEAQRVVPVRRQRFDPKKYAEQVKLGQVEIPVQNPSTPNQPEADASPRVQATRRASLDRTSFELLEGGAGLMPTLPQNKGTPSTTGIEAGQGESVKKTSGQPLPGIGDVPELPQAPTNGQDLAPAVPSIKSGDFDRDRIEVSEIFKWLVEWMKRHPATLSPVIKQFLEHRNGALTSEVRFKIDRKRFTMYLLCFEPNYEVRIALVEKNEVTYLVDQGFTKESQKLRAGRVTRVAGKADIATLQTQPLPIGHPKNSEFYNIFMSWWESVKHEVKK